ERRVVVHGVRTEDLEAVEHDASKSENDPSEPRHQAHVSTRSFSKCSAMMKTTENRPERATRRAAMCQGLTRAAGRRDGASQSARDRMEVEWRPAGRASPC